MVRAIAIATILVGVACACSTTPATYSATPFVVTPTHDANVTVSPSIPTAASSGGTQTFSVTAASGYKLDDEVRGTCPSGSWSGASYTTGAITANCTVNFSAHSGVSYTVSQSGNHLTCVPSSSVAVVGNATATFTPTGNAGYAVTQNVTGTCTAGVWGAGAYTTGPVTADCSVIFEATAIPYTVTASDENTTSLPAGAQMMYYGDTQTYAVATLFQPGYTVSRHVSGNCPAGSWSGGNYTTGSVVGSCTVGFHADGIYYTVTPSNTNTTLSPGGIQTVFYQQQQAFSVTPASRYAIVQNVTGTCPNGTWNGNDYTTGAINGNCTVGFDAYRVVATATPAGGPHLTVSPNMAKTVSTCDALTYNVQADFGFYAASTDIPVACPIISNAWNGNNYTTGGILQDCNVVLQANLIVPEISQPYIRTQAITQIGGGNVMVSLSWNAATDRSTQSSDLNYLLCASSPSPAYGSFSTASQVANSNNCVRATGVTQGNLIVATDNIYLFNVVVSDVLNHNSTYQPKGEYTNTSLLDYIPLAGDTHDLVGNLDLAPTMFGGVTTTPGSWTTDRFGNPNNAYAFSGSNSQCLASVNNVDPSVAGQDYRTMTFWVNSASSSGVPISIGGNGNNMVVGNRFGLYGNGAHWSQWMLNEDVTLTVPPNSGGWQFWALVYSGSGGGSPETATAYLNGARVGQRSVWTNTPNLDTDPLFVGCAVNGFPGSPGALMNWFHGAIDDIRLFHTVLCDGSGNNGCGSSDNQIAALYNATRP